MRRWLASARPTQVFGEALALAAALIAFVVLTVRLDPGLRPSVVSLSLLLTSTLYALLAALRRELPQGGWMRQLLEEGATALALTVALGVLGMGLFAALGIDLMEGLVGPFTLGISGVLYLGFRIAVRIWLWWDSLRRTRLVWSLTHAHLVVALVVALGLIGLFVVGFLAPATRYYANSPETGPIAWVLDWVVFSVFPMASVLILFTVVGLALIAPPSALISYFVARRMTVRLKTLSEAAAAFRRGDYAVRAPVEGQDEVAQLQTAFNEMAAELERSIADLKTERDTVAGLLDARRKLIANVSHDLRTPAATIRSHLESALNRWQEDAPPDDLRQDLLVMLGEIDRLQKLVDDLFLLSRAEVGQLTLRRQPVDVEKVVRAVVSAAAPPAWQARRVEVLADVADDLPHAHADPDRLAQAMHNLVHNAIRHTPPGGIVAVSATSENGVVRIAVRDTGAGIDEAHLPHVWERFYQADPEAGGAGLGLSIVKELVELMGGTVAAESRTGQGSCFSISLPRA